MRNNCIKRQSILPRIDGIQRDIGKLNDLASLSLEEFSTEDNFIKAQFYLRRALEGVFHIGTHILSRMPGGRATEYKEIAVKLGVMSIVPVEFANNQLKNMAGYRNRLTHFYADVQPEEIYHIIQRHSSDFDIFLKHIREVLETPAKFNLTVE